MENPNVILNFGDLAKREASLLQRVALWLGSHGATLSGWLAYKLDQPFPVEVHFENEGEWIAWIAREGAGVSAHAKVMLDPDDLGDNDGMLTYLRLASEVLEGPVHLVLGGAEFGMAPRKEAARAKFAKVLSYFTEMCDDIDPAYAALTVEYEMEGPSQLSRDPTSSAFGNGYVSFRVVPETELRALLKRYPNVESRALPNGLVVLASPNFQVVDEKAPDADRFVYDYISLDIAALISQRLGVKK